VLHHDINLLGWHSHPSRNFSSSVPSDSQSDTHRKACEPQQAHHAKLKFWKARYGIPVIDSAGAWDSERIARYKMASHPFFEMTRSRQNWIFRRLIRLWGGKSKISISTRVFVLSSFCRFVFAPLLRWAFHAQNISWYPTLFFPIVSVVHAFFENIDNKVVVILLQLKVPLSVAPEEWDRERSQQWVRERPQRAVTKCGGAPLRSGVTFLAVSRDLIVGTC